MGDVVFQPEQSLEQKPTTKEKKWFLSVLKVGAVIVLGTVGIFAYQNFQLISKQASQIQPVPTPILAYPSTVSAPSYISKIDASLSFLQGCRITGQCIEEEKEIVASESVSVSIRFVSELKDSEIKFFEDLGVQFLRIDGEVSYSGTIYGADISWDKIGDVEKEDSVLRIESTWQPGLVPPSN